MAISKRNLPLAIVTGAGIGIGEATALTLGKLGYRVIVTDILDKEGKAFKGQGFIKGKHSIQIALLGNVPLTRTMFRIVD